MEGWTLAKKWPKKKAQLSSPTNCHRHQLGSDGDGGDKGSKITNFIDSNGMVGKKPSTATDFTYTHPYNLPSLYNESNLKISF